MLDAADAKHLNNWLKTAVPANLRNEVLGKMLLLLHRHPDLAGRGWPTVRRLAESA